MSGGVGRLLEKVAVVTGARGLGRGISLRFAQEGARVAVCDFSLKDAEATARMIEQQGGVAMPVHMDVSSEDSVDSGIDSVVKQLGSPDVLVSNAGIQMIAPLVDFSFADWKRMMGVHLDGAFLTSRACLRQMYAKKSGSVIFMGSVHSKEASLLKAPYITAKHGLEGLTRALAKESAPHNVKVNMICPGFVLTDLVQAQIPLQAEELGITEQEVIKNVMLKNTVDGEFTTVEDIAEGTLFFAAYPNLAVTGQSMIMSHGWHME